MNLKFDEEPKYEAYMALFEPLCGDRNNRPIQTFAPAPKVGQKRQRDPSDDILLDSTGAALRSERRLRCPCDERHLVSASRAPFERSPVDCPSG